jgi:hypothetical protein
MLSLWLLGVALVVSSLGTGRADPSRLQISRAAPAVFADGRVLVIGGASIEGPLRSVESWVPDQAQSPPFFRYAGVLAVARGGHTATVLPDGRVLVVGGGSGARARAAELCKPPAEWDVGEGQTQGWSLTGSLARNRSLHTASLLADGRVLVVGGIDDNNHELASAEIWNPRSGTWRSAGRLHDGRWHHAAVVLDDGRVLVVGGLRSSRAVGAEALSSAEVWDPKAERWSTTGELPDPAAQLTASLLPDGHVLAAGGTNPAGGGPAGGNPIWDPENGRWSRDAAGGLMRYGHTVSVLGDGRIVAAGGVTIECGNRGCKWTHTSDVEIWNPNKHVWTPAHALGLPRAHHSAVVLPDHQLVIIGGLASYRNPEYTSDVEVVRVP